MKKVLILSHEEILNLEIVKTYNKLIEGDDKIVCTTGEIAQRNGTRRLTTPSSYYNQTHQRYYNPNTWIIYPHKGTIRDNKYLKKKGLSFKTIEDWEYAIGWIIQHHSTKQLDYINLFERIK